MTEAEAPIFIQFAGQGVKYMDDLRRIYQSFPDIVGFIQEAVFELNNQAALYDDSRTGFFSEGLDVMSWISSPGTTPGEGYLLSSPLSHPLIFLTQISTYMTFLLEGIDPKKLLARTHSATGFSTGIVAAILVSMGLTYNELKPWAIKVLAMFVWQGIRCQESMLNAGCNPVLDSQKLDSPEGSPSCMASIKNLLRGKLLTAIEAGPARDKVFPAYELFPGRWIVSGQPHDLVVFQDYLKKNEPQSSWRYVPSTIGAHSPLLAHAYDTSPKDARRLNLVFPGKDMHIPVLSNDQGTDIRCSDDILDDVMRAYFLYPGQWRKQISPVLPKTAIRYILDFGPGTGVASLTQNHCATAGIQVIRCSLALGRKQFLDDIRPELGL